MEIYLEGGGAHPIAAFINVGGSDASLGSSPMILDVEPGLNDHLDLPPEEQRGVLFQMAARGIPVIHLLHVRGLAQRHGLPWDPMPLPAAGSTPLRDPARPERAGFWIVTALYVGGLGAVGAWGRGGRRPPG
jgi:hypothetical protein